MNEFITKPSKTTQECLDEMTHVSSNLTQSLGFEFNLGHPVVLKLLRRTFRPFGSHNARGVSLCSCTWRISDLHP